MYILAMYYTLLDSERTIYCERSLWGRPERAALALLRGWMMDHSEELAATGAEISRLLSGVGCRG